MIGCNYNTDNNASPNKQDPKYFEIEVDNISQIEYEEGNNLFRMVKQEKSSD